MPHTCVHVGNCISVGFSTQKSIVEDCSMVTLEDLNTGRTTVPYKIPFFWYETFINTGIDIVSVAWVRRKTLVNINLEFFRIKISCLHNLCDINWILLSVIFGNLQFKWKVEVAKLSSEKSWCWLRMHKFHRSVILERI